MTCGDPIMKYCQLCGESIYTECRYNGKVFCSTECMDTYLLNRCVSEEISFLDLPADVRNRERHSRAYKCTSRQCPVCGTVFYVSNKFDEDKKKYCSERCKNVSLRKTWFIQGVKHSGFASHKWRGGVSDKKYCFKFNDDLKKRVREFFNDVCFVCGKSSSENGKALSVHHVNHNKNSGCDGTEVSLIPLCKSCHRKVHSNEIYWDNYINNILNVVYDKKCYFTVDEYLDYKYGEISP